MRLYSGNIHLKIALFCFGASALIILDWGNMVSKEAFSFLTYFLVSVAVAYKSNIPRIIKLLLIGTFLIKSWYAYDMFLTDISPFRDTFGYFENLRDMNNLGVDLDTVVGITGTFQFGYNYLNYIVFSLFGTTYSLYLTNIFMFGVSTILFYNLIISDFEKKIAEVSTIAMLLSTNMFLFTSNILKDSLVLFLSLLALFAYKVSTNKITFIIPLLLLFTVRIYAAGAVLVGIFANILMTSNMKRSRKILLVLTGIVGIYGLTLFPFAANYTRLIRKFLWGIDAKSVVVAPLVSLFKFYFAPLFWNLLIDQGTYLMTFTDSFIALSLSFAPVLFFVKFFKHKALREKTWMYMMIMFVYAVALGIEYGGDSTRQRIGIYSFIILTYVIGLLYTNKKHLDGIEPNSL